MLKKIKDIIEGNYNHLVGLNKDDPLYNISLRRLSICLECEHKTNSSIKLLKPYIKCGKCGCPLESKVKAPMSSCPIGKWGAVPEIKNINNKHKTVTMNANRMEMIATIKENYPNGFVHMIIPGHGGMINGKYVTAPKKMFEFDDGTTVYEGVENRKIVKEVLAAAPNNITIRNMVPEEEDISLAYRIARVNRLKKEYKKKEGKLAIVHELHANAGGGTGFEAYTTRKDNFSDLMAEIWLAEQEKMFPNQRNREHKEKDFYVIREIETYGYLAESYFFDSAADVALNCSREGIIKNAQVLINTMTVLDNLLV